MKLRYILFLAAVIFIGWNKLQYDRSFDRCEQLLAETKYNLQTLHSEISELRSAMGTSEAEYE